METCIMCLCLYMCQYVCVCVCTQHLHYRWVRIMFSWYYKSWCNAMQLIFIYMRTFHIDVDSRNRIASNYTGSIFIRKNCLVRDKCEVEVESIHHVAVFSTSGEIQTTCSCVISGGIHTITSTSETQPEHWWTPRGDNYTVIAMWNS